MAPGTSTLEPLLQVTRAVPIVFVHVADPVGGGLVESLAHPGGPLMDVDARLRAPRGPHADARLRADARGRDGGVRQELAVGVADGKS